MEPDDECHQGRAKGGPRLQVRQGKGELGSSLGYHPNWAPPLAPISIAAGATSNRWSGEALPTVKIGMTRAPTHIEHTVQAIARLRAEHDRRASPLQRTLERFTARAGSPGFVAGT